MQRLKDKALKSFFKIRNNLYDGHCDTSIRLFQTLVVPTLSYCCEIWAPYMLPKLNDDRFHQLCDKLPGEALHIKVCKTILGVNKKATNNAVRGELGSFPVLLQMLKQSIKYW